MDAGVLAELRDAFRYLGIDAIEIRPDRGGRAVIRVSGQSVATVEVKSRSTVAATDAQRLLDRDGRAGPGIVVADRLSNAARELLADGGWGWLDRRGHVRVVVPPVVVDAALPRLSLPGAPEEPLQGQVALEVAAAHLIQPARALAVRELARLLNRAPSAVSTAQRRLREAGLLRSDGTPRTADLFRELAGRWRPRWVALAQRPTPNDENVRSGDVRTQAWALTGWRAAALYGAGAVVADFYPPEFLLHDPRQLRAAVNMLGTPDSADQRSCLVAVSPIRSVFLHLTEWRWPSPGAGWPVAHPLFVALDLARDARGEELLRDWDPQGYTRVW